MTAEVIEVRGNRSSSRRSAEALSSALRPDRPLPE
jgi:hypothetical protein